jgi:hypothetical protein
LVENNIKVRMKKKIIIGTILIIGIFLILKIRKIKKDNDALIENTLKVKAGYDYNKVNEIMGEPIDIFPMKFPDKRGEFEVYLYDAPILGSGGVEVWFKNGLVDYIYDGIK